MKHFALVYDVVDGFSDKRMPHREPHLALVRAAHARGKLVMAGALGDPPDGALLVFRGDSAESPNALRAPIRTSCRASRRGGVCGRGTS